MGWSSVNRFNDMPQSDGQSCVTIHEASTDDLASQYRVNVLAAAERLASSWPRKKRRCSVAIQKDTKMASKATDDKIRKNLRIPETLSPHRYNANHQGKAPVRVSPRNRKRLADYLQDTTSTNVNKHIEPDFGHDSLSGVKDGLERQTVSSYDLAASTVSYKRLLVESNVTESDTAIPTIIEISSDESLDFEDFDESIFDDVFDLDTTQSSLTPEATVSPPSKMVTPGVSVEGLRPQYPNQAPYPPFLHPCLMESLRADIITSEKCKFSGISPSYTCFRVAELIRLSSVLISHPGKHSQEVIVELFATVREVRYANSLGQGQGLVLADCFFPEKPPYLITKSRSPLSARDCFRTGENREGPKKLVKTLVKCTAITQQSQLAREAHISTVDFLESPAPKHFDNIAIGMDFEVLDVRESSWDEIGKVREMILRDFQARYEASVRAEPNLIFGARSNNVSKQSHCETHDDLSKQQDSDEYFDQLSDIIDFSDVEFDLPDLMNLIGTDEA